MPTNRRIHTVTSLAASGTSRRAIAREVNEGRLIPLRPGVWANAGETTARQHQLDLVTAASFLAPTSALSHVTASAVHALPLPSKGLDHLWVTNPRPGGGHRRRLMTTIGRMLPPEHVVVIDGRRTTTLERTVIDMATEFGFETGLMTADAALRLGADPQVLADVLETCGRPRGLGHARQVVAFADGRIESPGESLIRAKWHCAGVPQPVPQFVIRNSTGQFLGRGDFAWPDERVLAEYDGRTKYGSLLKPGQSVQDVIIAEKKREAGIVDAGWTVLRFTVKDLATTDGSAQRILRALDRAGRAAGPQAG